MDCKSARTALIRRLADDLPPGRDAALESHLSACHRCAERARQYEQTRDAARALPTPDLPEQVVEACDRALEEVRPSDLPSSGPPADPAPVAGFWKRAAIFSICLLGLAGVAVGAVLVAAHYAEPAVQTGRITYRAGTIETGYPGSLRWSEAPPMPEIYEETILRTGTDGFLRIDSAGATWWVDSNTTVTFPEPRFARLAGGRILGRIASDQDRPTRLSTPHGGTVQSVGGSFVLRATPARLMATCLSGSLTVSGRENNTVLSAGQRTMVAEGKLAQKSRPALTPRAAGWTRRFGSAPDDALPREGAPLLPSPRRPAGLPEGLRIQRLALRVEIRGPLVLCVATAHLTNRAQKSWQGRLDAADLLWPHPVASTPGEKVELAPGQSAEITSAALGSMLAGGETLTIGIMPAGWTAETIPELVIDLAGDPAAFESARCTTRQIELSQDRDTLPNRADLRDVSPERPIVFKFSPGNSKRTDGFVLRGPDSNIALGAWRAGFQADLEIGRSRHVLVAFDAAARYESAGRSYAHALAEQITGRLSRHTRLLVAAYEGQVKLLPSAGPRAGPMGRERMMATLWELEGGGAPDPAPLLNWCASFPAREPSLAFVLTDGQTEPDDLPLPPDGSHPRTFLLHTNQVGEADKAGRLCAALGGAALDLPAGLSAEQAALLALRNVSWPGYRELDLQLSVPAGAAGHVLTAPGTPSNVPVLWIERAKRDADRFSGRLRAVTTQEDRATNFTLSAGDQSTADLPEGVEARLAAELNNLLD